MRAIIAAIIWLWPIVCLASYNNPPPSVPSGVVVADAIYQQFVVSTAAVTFTSNITLATITGLSIPLTAGKTYNCRGHLMITASGVSGGIKVALVATNSLSATSMRFTASNFNAAVTNARTSSTTLGGTMGAATAIVTDVDLDGSIVVNAGGTINVQAAQNASNATSTVVGVGSTFQCVRVN